LALKRESKRNRSMKTDEDVKKTLLARTERIATRKSRKGTLQERRDAMTKPRAKTSTHQSRTHLGSLHMRANCKISTN